MEHIQRVIREYLVAIGEVYGKAYRTKMMVNYAGGTHLIVKHPTDEQSQLLHIGTVEEMTEYLRQQAQRQGESAA